MPAAPYFNNIPGTGVVAPLFAFEVNSGGLYEPIQRVILIGHGDGTGTAAANQVYNLLGSLGVADGLFGPNSMLREMARAALRSGPGLPLFGIMVAATGVAAQWTLTLTSWTGTGVAAVDIEGEQILVPVGTSDTPTTIATALAAAINGYWNQLTGKKLAVTAASSAGVVTLTARQAGLVYNSVLPYLRPNVQGNVLTASTLTIAQSVQGSGSPALTTALANLGDTPADMIISPFSDATSLAAYANATNDTSGRWAWNRQSYGHVCTTYYGSLSAQATLGASLNDRHLSVFPTSNFRNPDWTVAASIYALAAVWLLDITTGNVSRAQSGLAALDVGAPYLTGNYLQWATQNSLLLTGISTWSVNQGGQVCINKLITTYQYGLQGQPDVTFRDIQKMFQVSGSLAFIRAALAVEQGNKSIMDSNPGSLLAATTTKDIAATIVNAYRKLNLQGVLDDVSAFTNNIVCVRNATNPNRVDVYAPIVTVSPLDVIAANATIYAALSAEPANANAPA